MTSPYDDRSRQYDAWFEAYPLVHEAELRAVRSLLPAAGRGLEVGVGSGRFAGPLGVGLGIDVSLPMLAMAKGRGLAVAAARAEALPLRSGSLDYLLMVTVLCFVDDVRLALGEARRVLRGQGRLVVAILDRQSPLGRVYAAQRQGNDFYREARFLSVDELLVLLRQAGFSDFAACQTIHGELRAVTAQEPVRPGWGEGIFAVLAASCWLAAKDTPL